VFLGGQTVRSLNVLSSEADKSGSQKHRSKTQYSGRFIIRSPTPVNSEWELNQSLFDIFVTIGQSKPQTYDRCFCSPGAKVLHSRCHESIVGRNAHIRMPILTFMLLAHVLLNITGTRYKIVVFRQHGPKISMIPKPSSSVLCTTACHEERIKSSIKTLGNYISTHGFSQGWSKKRRLFLGRYRQRILPNQ
jgi:hypothetical protein